MNPVLSLFEVVAEPSRRRILDLLRVERRAVGDLVEALGLAQPAVSKHLRVLREAGLVVAEVDAQRRLYRLNAAPLREVDAWVAPYRRHWAAHLDGLERHLESMPDPPAPTGKTRKP
jgi:DNA-binding transcriptional ArsR family regulator